MALQLGRASQLDLPLITLVVAAAAAVIIALNAVFGVGPTVSFTEITPDPAGFMPF
jgi:hypothetical protein